MHSIKISHISDMHLGSSFSSLPYEKGQIRKKEYDYTCINVLKECSDCDIVVLSGDIFDSGDVSTTIADGVLCAIEQLNNTQVFMSCGNHDSYYTEIIQYCINNSPRNFHVFDPDVITCVKLESIKTAVYGVSFSKQHHLESMLKTMPQCNDSYINVLTMHADTQQGQYNPIDLSELTQYNLDYVALGHIHNFDGINKLGNLVCAYSGAVQGRGFDECGEKGFIKGELSKENCDLRFYPYSKRIYIDEIVDVTDFKSEYDLIDIVNSLSLSQENICRFTFVGTNNFGKEIDTKFIADQCMCFYCTCVDSTKTPMHLDEYLGYPGLIGACAHEAEKLLQASSNGEETEKIKKSFELLMGIFDNR